MVRQQVPDIASPIKMNGNRVFDFLTFLSGRTLRKRIKEQMVSEARTEETIYFSVYCISDPLHMISWSLRCLLFWGHSWGCREEKWMTVPGDHVLSQGLPRALGTMTFFHRRRKGTARAKQGRAVFVSFRFRSPVIIVLQKHCSVLSRTLGVFQGMMYPPLNHDNLKCLKCVTICFLLEFPPDNFNWKQFYLCHWDTCIWTLVQLLEVHGFGPKLWESGRFLSIFLVSDWHRSGWYIQKAEEVPLIDRN